MGGGAEAGCVCILSVPSKPSVGLLRRCYDGGAKLAPVPTPTVVMGMVVPVPAPEVHSPEAVAIEESVVNMVLAPEVEEEE